MTTTYHEPRTTFHEKEPAYKQLDVWKLGIGLVKKAYLLTQQFPKQEVYGLTSQLRRAAVSIPSNIAEGCARKNQKEFQQYLFVALGSLAELETQLVISSELGYVEYDSVQDVFNLVNKLRAMILNLVRSLKSRGTWNVDRGTFLCVLSSVFLVLGGLS